MIKFILIAGVWVNKAWVISVEKDDEGGAIVFIYGRPTLYDPRTCEEIIEEMKR